MKNTMKNTIKKASMMLVLAFAFVAFANTSSLAATLVVDPDLTQCAAADFGPFATIQGALSAAQPGDTVFVCPNMATFAPNTPEAYQGPIVVAIQNLTIIGVASANDGDSRVLIASSVDTPSTGGATSESRGIVTLDATGITFGNFTVDGGFTGAGGGGANGGAGAFNGVVVTDDASGSTVFNTTVRNIVNASAAGSRNNGNGILVEGGSTAAGAGVNVLNNVVSNFRANGIFVGDILSGGTSGTARGIVRGNYVNGNSATGFTPPAGSVPQRGVVFSNNAGGATFAGAATGGGTTGDIFNNRVASLGRAIGCSNAFTCSSAIALEAISGGVTVRFNVSMRNEIGIIGTNTSNLTMNNNQLYGILTDTSPTQFSLGIVLQGSDNANGSNFNTIQFNLIVLNSTAVLVGLGTDTTTGNIVRQNTFQDATFGVADAAISTVVGTGATSNTNIQVDNFYFDLVP
jgi:hypothetical protein